jgi:hypothetical protein
MLRPAVHQILELEASTWEKTVWTIRMSSTDAGGCRNEEMVRPAPMQMERVNHAQETQE